MWALAFGPAPQLFGHQVLYKAPYAWLMTLPAFSNGLRVPARFAMLASLCLAIAVGMALTRLLGRRPSTWRTSVAVTAGLLALMVAEVWPRDFPLVAAPDPLAVPAVAARHPAVVELPLGGVAEDTVAIYHSMSHGRPVVNGYSGYDPPHYALLRLAVRLGDPDGLAAIARHATLLVAIHKDRDRDDAREQFVRRIPGVTLVERTDAAAFYLVPRQAASGASETVPSAPIRAVVASEAQDRVDQLRDGRLDTVWSTRNRQQGGEQLVVELAAARDVCGAGLALGPVIAGFPRQLELAVSGDGRSWTPAWTGPTVGLAVDAALRDPKRLEIRIETTRQPGVRLVRLTQRGEAEEDEWAIAELSIAACR